MKKEIKLRAWIFTENKMSFQNEWFSIYPFDVIQYADQGYWINNLDADEKHKEKLRKENIKIKDDFALMQYTGLKDKNGKDIYEGDILIAFKKPYEDKPTVKKAEFKQGCWKTVGNDKNAVPLFNYNKEDIQVVGNIYENPELLDTKK